MPGNIKRKEGGSLNEQKILNPNFGTNPKRNALAFQGRATKKVKLGKPNQQLNAALQGFGSGYATHFVQYPKKPTYNEQMKDVAYYAMVQGKQLAAKQQAIQTWSDRNYSNNNTKLNY
jgi:hypothetical protein